MKKLLSVRDIGYWILGISLFFVFSKTIHAQEVVEIPGPEIKEAGFIQVKELNIGDVVFVKGEEGLVPEQITKLEYKQEPVEVYNLSVDGEETFFANDFAVHNKGSERDAVCFIEVAPRIQGKSDNQLRDEGYLETWNVGNHGNAFRNLFQYYGIGPGGNGYTEGGGDQVCRFGQVINGCLYKRRSCISAGQPCRGCYPAFGTTCAPSSHACYDCELTCGPGKFGHLAGDSRLRFTEHIICDGEQPCGAALKVTAPTGYVIKSFTFSVDFRMCNKTGCHGSLNFSRGMRWHLSDGLRANAIIASYTSSGKRTIQMDRGTKYFFVYSQISEKENPENDCNVNSFELYDMELNLLKTDDVHEAEAEVINNSLVYYVDDAMYTHKVGIWHFRAVEDGKIQLSIDSGSTWGSVMDIPEGGNFSYPLTLNPGENSVMARVKFKTAEWSYCADSILYPAPTGTIQGTVFEGSSCSELGETVSGGTVQIAGYGTDTPDPDYSFEVPIDQLHTVMMTAFPGEYSDPIYCDDEGDETNQVMLTEGGETKTINIGLTKAAGSWFQAQEGDVHSQESINSDLPGEDDNFCLAGEGGTPGVVSHKETLGDNPWGEGNVSVEGWLANTEFSRKRFNYFYELLGSPEEDYGGGLPSDSGVYYTADALTVDGWSIPEGTKIVILVDNEVNIDSNLDVNGFLAIIASGKIKVAETVTQVEGVFITDKEFEVDKVGEGNDVQFVGEGVFVAQSFELARDLGEDLNRTRPAEKFVYRPDFLMTAPSVLFTPSYTWQEIPP
ncbi:MAG TPA: Hint domain-containing protein [Patescibacteria group bacterium]|nr:Hint domain-containing protein [Patescibacteria group bacterium]